MAVLKACNFSGEATKDGPDDNDHFTFKSEGEAKSSDSGRESKRSRGLSEDSGPPPQPKPPLP